MKQDIQKATKLFWDVRKAKGVRSCVFRLM